MRGMKRPREPGTAPLPGVGGGSTQAESDDPADRLAQELFGGMKQMAAACQVFYDMLAASLALAQQAEGAGSSGAATTQNAATADPAAESAGSAVAPPAAKRVPDSSRASAPGARVKRECAAAGPCGYPGCRRRATFGYSGDAVASSCRPHCMPGMTKIVPPESSRCRHEGCLKHPCYGYEGQPRKFCFQHRMDGMVNVVFPACHEDGCKRRATLCDAGKTRPTACPLHRRAGMVVMGGATHCRHEGCTAEATHGPKGAKGRAFCAQHRPGGIEEVTQHRPGGKEEVVVGGETCSHAGCTMKPAAGNPAGVKQRFCLLHRRGDGAPRADKAEFV